MEKSENYDSSYYSCDDVLAVAGYILSLCIILLGIGLIIENILGIVQKIYIPELTVIEYIKKYALKKI